MTLRAALGAGGAHPCAVPGRCAERTRTLQDHRSRRAGGHVSRSFDLDQGRAAGLAQNRTMSSAPPGCIIVKPFSVLIACQGCPAAGQAARDVARLLDRRRVVESAWLGTHRACALARAPGAGFASLALDRERSRGAVIRYQRRLPGLARTNSTGTAAERTTPSAALPITMRVMPRRP